MRINIGLLSCVYLYQRQRTASIVSCELQKLSIRRGYHSIRSRATLNTDFEWSIEFSGSIIQPILVLEVMGRLSDCPCVLSYFIMERHRDRMTTGWTGRSMGYNIRTASPEAVRPVGGIQCLFDVLPLHWNQCRRNFLPKATGPDSPVLGHGSTGQVICAFRNTNCRLQSRKRPNFRRTGLQSAYISSVLKICKGSS